MDLNEINERFNEVIGWFRRLESKLDHMNENIFRKQPKYLTEAHYDLILEYLEKNNNITRDQVMDLLNIKNVVSALQVLKEIAKKNEFAILESGRGSRQTTLFLIPDIEMTRKIKKLLVLLPIASNLPMEEVREKLGLNSDQEKEFWEYLHRYFPKQFVTKDKRLWRMRR